MSLYLLFFIISGSLIFLTFPLTLLAAYFEKNKTSRSFNFVYIFTVLIICLLAVADILSIVAAILRG